MGIFKPRPKGRIYNAGVGVSFESGVLIMHGPGGTPEDMAAALDAEDAAYARDWRRRLRDRLMQPVYAWRDLVWRARRGRLITEHCAYAARSGALVLFPGGLDRNEIEDTLDTLESGADGAGFGCLVKVCGMGTLCLTHQFLTCLFYPFGAGLAFLKRNVDGKRAKRLSEKPRSCLEFERIARDGDLTLHRRLFRQLGSSVRKACKVARRDDDGETS